MKYKLLIAAVALGVTGAAVVGGITSALADEAAIEADIGELRGAILSLLGPRGAIATETNPNYKSAAAPAPAAPRTPAAADWPSYNKTLTSERFSDLSQINTRNAGKLKVLCTYNTGRFTSFESGLIMVEGALIGTTEFDIFSIDPATCAENWRTHEEYPGYVLPTNRGAAYLDGMLFRGTEDGRVLGYDFKTGRRLWETTIADAKKGEAVPAAPIAWEGLVFIGNAGGDFKGGKGRMYALEAKTGKIVWEFFLVPKSEGDRALPHSINRRGITCPARRSAAGEPGLLRPWTRPLGSCMCPSAIPRPTSTTASAKGTISSPAPSLSSTPRPALTKIISS
jgi:alcohol dehydrogenase (cytochrome c)